MPLVLQQMQETNRRLSRVLELIRQQESGPLRIEEVDLAGLSAELRKVEQLRAAMPDRDKSLAATLTEYKERLQGLAALLPGLQARFAAEKARLERDRSHLQAASGWAQSQEVLRRR